MKFHKIAACVAALFMAVPVAAAPGDMSVATFLKKAEPLVKRGPLALLSSDFNLLKREFEAASKSYDARVKADKRAKRKPHSCPPKGKKIGISAEQILEHMRSYPAAKRSRTTVRTAFADMMKKRFPCR